MDIEAEKTFIARFVKPDLRERWQFMLGNRRRSKHLIRLYHHFEFVAKRVEKLKVREGSATELETLFATARLVVPVYVISTSPKLDGKWVSIQDFEGHVPDGTVIYSEKANAAIYRDEYDFYLLSNHI